MPGRDRRGVLAVWLVKLGMLGLCSLGLVSVFRPLGWLAGAGQADQQAVAGPDHRDRQYELRRNLSLAACARYEEEITLHTVKASQLSCIKTPLVVELDKVDTKVLDDRCTTWCRPHQSD